MKCMTCPPRIPLRNQHRASATWPFDDQYPIIGASRHTDFIP